MANKPKIGRPKLPKGASRKGRLYCRLLAKEEDEIEDAAKRAGESKSKWIRDVLLRAARDTVKESP